MSPTDVVEVAKRGPFLGPPGLPRRSGAPRRPLARAFLGLLGCVCSCSLFCAVFGSKIR